MKKDALRLTDYLQQMRQAATDAISYVEGMDKAGFVEDRRTQQAVVFNLVVLGEAAASVLSGHAGFAEQHPEVPWRSIRATRNRVAHGYFDINIDVVWDTVRVALPQLLTALAPVPEAAAALPPGPPPAVAS